jgi:hypothetical protein
MSNAVSLSNLKFFTFLGRYSIFLILFYPIYYFSSGDYSDKGKMTVAILCFLVVITTLYLWKYNNFKSMFWTIADRGAVLAIAVLMLVFDTEETYPFILSALIFYFDGYLNSWKNQSSFMSHVVFRYFMSVALNTFFIDKPTLNKSILGANSFLTLINILLILEKVDYTPKNGIVF